MKLEYIDIIDTYRNIHTHTSFIFLPAKNKQNFSTLPMQDSAPSSWTSLPAGAWTQKSGYCGNMLESPWCFPSFSIQVGISANSCKAGVLYVTFGDFSVAHWSHSGFSATGRSDATSISAGLAGTDHILPLGSFLPS